MALYSVLFPCAHYPEDSVVIPLLTNHRALQRLAFHGSLKHVLSVLARLPLVAPSSLVCIYYNIFLVRSGEPELTKASESELKAVDLALCDSKFRHLTCVQLSESKYGMINYIQI